MKNTGIVSYVDKWQLKEVTSRILTPLETTGWISFSLEGFKKSLFTILKDILPRGLKFHWRDSNIHPEGLKLRWRGSDIHLEGLKLRWGNDIHSEGLKFQCRDSDIHTGGL